MASCFVCATRNLGRKKSTGTEPKTMPPYRAQGYHERTTLAHAHLKKCSIKSFVGSMGSGLDNNYITTTRPSDHQYTTINESLWYLVTEEIEEHGIVYG